VSEGGEDSRGNGVRPKNSHGLGQVAPDYGLHAAEQSSLRGGVDMSNAEL